MVFFGSPLPSGPGGQLREMNEFHEKMSKSPWIASSFCMLVAFFGSGPNCASPGMAELRTIAGFVDVAAAVAVGAAVDVDEAAAVSVDVVASVALTGSSLLHATASASSGIVANLLMCSPSFFKRGTCGTAERGWADRRWAESGRPD